MNVRAAARVAGRVLAIAVAVLAGGCGGGAGGDAAGNVGASPRLSIVVLGDSIASGEGIDYGYTYVYYAEANLLSHWSGGSSDPQWQGAYPLCHDSAGAYGDVLAPMLGATLAKFACTGSTYENGIVYDRRYAGALYRPAQFGNWLAGTGLNPDYDAAKPDVVIVTFGADDVSFADIATFCATGYTAADAQTVEALARAPAAERGRRLRADYVARIASAGTRAPRGARAGAESSSYCTQANPGAPIETLFWDPIRSGQIAGNYRNLVAAIKARGEKTGKVPRIIFTTYPQPLPADGQSDECADLLDLERDELDYLISLQGTMKATLLAAVAGIEGVTVADVSGVMRGHEFCTPEPWAYGLSVLRLDTASLAPFHPTPAGQAAIAAVLQQQLVGR